MNTYQDIKFTASESVSKLTSGKVCYQGQIIHNQALDVDETRKRFADYMQRPEAMANYAIDCIGGFIAQEVARGNHINLGPFSVGIKMRGGLPAANAPFESNTNTLSIELTPSKKLKKALRELKPINVTDLERIKITSSMQEQPYQLQDKICTSGPRIVSVYGVYVSIHPETIGEGIWIENDAGEKLLTSEYIAGDALCSRVRMTGDIAPGLYWLVVCSRRDGEEELRRVQRRITAV